MRILDPNFFVVGGPLHRDDRSYVERRADRLLWERLAAGEYCYVLTPRQMGKSSLMARTAARLRMAGVRVAGVDLSAIGGESNQDERSWYYGLLYRIHRDLNLATPLKVWWNQRLDLPIPQRWVEYFREVVLREGDPENPRPVVVFLDEIDTTINLSFSDGFFAAVRACYNARALEPDFGRICFVLLGVATPDQLISDPKRTPFNIGCRIELNPFDLEEVAGLAEGLGDSSQDLLARTLYWTGGQPYLTQVLCRLVAEVCSEGDPGTVGDDEAEATIDRLVETQILSSKTLREETHLRNVEARLLATPGSLLRLLAYRRILRGNRVVDSPTSSTLSTLKLTGIARPDPEGVLQVSNRIYERLFGLSWVHSQIALDRTRLAAAGALVASLLLFAYWYAAIEPRAWVEQLRVVDDDFTVAQLAHDALSSNRLFPQKRADNLLAEFWERRASSAEFAEDRGQALLYRLKAIEASDTELRRRRAQDLIGNDWTRLAETLRHTSKVMAVVFSPEGDKVLTVDQTDDLRVWDATTGAPIGPEIRGLRDIVAVAFEPKTGNLVTTNPHRAQRWSLVTGSPIAIGEPIALGGGVLAAALSPAGSRLLTGHEDRTARLWELESGEEVGESFPHGAKVTAVAFGPDDRTLLTGGRDGIALLWQVGNGVPLGEAMRHAMQVTAVAFSPKGDSVLTGSEDGTARLWDAETGEPIGQPMRHDAPALGGVFAVAYSPDGRLVLTGSEDGTAQLWDAETGEPIGRPMRHARWVGTVAFSPDGTRVVTGSEDRTARLWHVDPRATRVEAMPHSNWVGSVAFSPDGSQVLVGSPEGSARLWDADSGVPMGQPLGPEDSEPSHGVGAVALSPDGKTAITGSDDGTARLWEVSSGALLGELEDPGRALFAMAFDTDDQRTITVAQNGVLQWWETDSGRPLVEPHRLDPWVHPLAFSPVGDSALISTSRGTATLWDLSSRTPRGQPLAARVSSADFSPDGRQILTASESTAALWEASSGAAIGQPMHQDSRIVSVAFGRKGILTGSEDGIVQRWSRDSTESLGEPMPASRSPVLAFSPSDLWVLTAGNNSLAQVWSWASGEVVRSLRSDGKILSAAIRPRGLTNVILGSETGLVQLRGANELEVQRRRMAERLASSEIHSEGRVLTVDLAHDRPLALTGSHHGILQLWDLESGEQYGDPMRHDREVRAAVFSPDGKTILTGSNDGIARLWQADSGTLLSEIRHDRGIRTVAFSPDGGTVLTGCDGGIARLRKATPEALGASLGEPMHHDQGVTTAAFSPDGARVLTGSVDGTAWLWDTKTGGLLAGPMRLDQGVRKVAFAANGQLLTGSESGAVQLWTASGTPIGSPKYPQHRVHALAISSDGSKIASGSADGSAQLWDAASGEPIGEPMWHEGSVLAVAFDDGATLLATGSRDRSARLWDAASGRQVGETMRHEGIVTSLAFSRTEPKLITGSADRTARLWSTSSGEPIGEPMRHSAPVVAVAFDPDETAVTGSHGGALRFWDSASGAPAGGMHTRARTTAVAVSPDGSLVLSGSELGNVWWWDAPDNRPSIQASNRLLGGPLSHEDRVHAVAFGPEGRRVVTGCADGGARLWEMETGDPIGQPFFHDSEVLAVALSPDGKTLVTGTDDGVWLWDVASRTRRRGPNHDAEVLSVAVHESQEQMQVLTGSGDGIARLWDSDSGDLIAKPMRHGGRIISVGFDPKRSRVLTGSDDGVVRIWDSTNAKPLGPARHHSRQIRAVAFTPDGSSVVTGSADGTARIWDVSSRTPVGEPIHLDGGVRAVAFGPDGNKVLTASEDKTARAWFASSGLPAGISLDHNNWALAVAFSPDGTRLLTGGTRGRVWLWDADSGKEIGNSLQLRNRVLAVTFSPDGRAWMRTRNWLHSAEVTPEGLSQLRSHFAPVAAWHFSKDCDPCDEIKLVVDPTEQSLGVWTLGLDEALSETPLVGKPQDLLEEWKERLALEFDGSQGKFVPATTNPVEEISESESQGRVSPSTGS